MVERSPIVSVARKTSSPRIWRWRTPRGRDRLRSIVQTVITSLMRRLQYRFEWSSDEIRRVGYRVIDLIAEYLTTLPSKPAFQPFPQELATEFLHSTPPRTGQDLESILVEFAAEDCPLPLRTGTSPLLGLRQSPTGPYRHLRRGAGCDDEQQLWRGKPRRILRRTPGDRLVQAGGWLPARGHGSAR